jgi:hypothetical protein
MSDTTKERFKKIYAFLDKIDERDRLTRELAERVLAWWNDGTLVNKPFKDDPNCVPFIITAKQLLKLYEEEKP